jgi:hypothetical protein
MLAATFSGPLGKEVARRFFLADPQSLHGLRRFVTRHLRAVPFCLRADGRSRSGWRPWASEFGNLLIDARTSSQTLVFPSYRAATIGCDASSEDPFCVMAGCVCVEIRERLGNGIQDHPGKDCLAN